MLNLSKIDKNGVPGVEWGFISVNFHLVEVKGRLTADKELVIITEPICNNFVTFKGVLKRRTI